MPNPDSAPAPEPIAIVGMGCRFPGGVAGPRDYWRLLCNGDDAITEIPAERWSSAKFFDARRGRPGKTAARHGGFVPLDRFDAEFFGISPREAARMDPQQRLLMEVAWEALEDGGIVIDRQVGMDAAVFVGISSFDYSWIQFHFHDRTTTDIYTNTGNAHRIAANSIYY